MNLRRALCNSNSLARRPRGAAAGAAAWLAVCAAPALPLAATLLQHCRAPLAPPVQPTGLGSSGGAPPAAALAPSQGRRPQRRLAAPCPLRPSWAPLPHWGPAAASLGGLGQVQPGCKAHSSLCHVAPRFRIYRAEPGGSFRAHNRSSFRVARPQSGLPPVSQLHRLPHGTRHGSQGLQLELREWGPGGRLQAPRGPQRTRRPLPTLASLRPLPPFPLSQPGA